MMHSHSSPRFLNIRLDSISVLDEARHPHMVLDVHSSIRLPHSYLFLDGSEKLLYSRFRREVCAAPCRTRRYSVAGGRDTTRYEVFLQ
jgi:hypothetical protein